MAVAPATMAHDNHAVVLPAGENASGLAHMMGQHLEQTLADSPDKRAEAAALRGRFGLVAREGNVAVTVVFDERCIIVGDGLHEPDAVISGEVEYLLHVLAGRVNVAGAVREGRVAVRARLRNPLLAYRAYHLMRLPGVHVWSGLPRPPSRLVAGAAVAAGVTLLAWQLRRARARR